MPAPSATIYLTSAALAVLAIGLAAVLLARRYRRRRVHAAAHHHGQKPVDLESSSSSSSSSPPSRPGAPSQTPPTQHRRLPSGDGPTQPQPGPPISTVARAPAMAGTERYLAPSGDPWTPLPPPGGPLPVPPPVALARESGSPPRVHAPAHRHIIMAVAARRDDGG